MCMRIPVTIPLASLIKMALVVARSQGVIIDENAIDLKDIAMQPTEANDLEFVIYTKPN